MVVDRSRMVAGVAVHRRRCARRRGARPGGSARARARRCERRAPGIRPLGRLPRAGSRGQRDDRRAGLGVRAEGSSTAASDVVRVTRAAEAPADDRFGFDPLPSTPTVALILGLTAGLVLAWSI